MQLIHGKAQHIIHESKQIGATPLSLESLLQLSSLALLSHSLVHIYFSPLPRT